MKNVLSGKGSPKLVKVILRRTFPAAHLFLRILGGIGLNLMHPGLAKTDFEDLVLSSLMSRKTHNISEPKKLRQENECPDAAIVGRSDTGIKNALILQDDLLQLDLSHIKIQQTTQVAAP